MVQMICPFCEQPIGVEGNRFQFDIVTFTLEDPNLQEKKRKKGEESELRNICAIYCENCGKVLGLTP